MKSFVRGGGLAALALLLHGCVSLRPMAEVRRELPAADFLRIDGHLVHVEQAGPPAGEPVVLVHGFGESTYTWRKVIPGLAAAHRVVAVDLFGFGYTERPEDPASYTRAGQERLILGVLDALHLPRVHLVGHSYGGSISLYLASRHLERLRSLVLVDSAGPEYPVRRRTRLARLRPLDSFFLRAVALRPGLVARALRAAFWDDSLVTPDLVAAYRDRLRIEGAVDAYYGLTARGQSDPETVDLARIDVPALVIWGAEDQLVSLAEGRKAAARLPRAELVVLPETGHVPMEERPEDFLRLVLGFLDRQGAPAP